MINIASTAGRYGWMLQRVYNSSKHAVAGPTRCLGLEPAKTRVTTNAMTRQSLTISVGLILV